MYLELKNPPGITSQWVRLFTAILGVLRSEQLVTVSNSLLSGGEVLRVLLTINSSSYSVGTTIEVDVV